MGAEGNPRTSPERVGRNRRGQGLVQLSFGGVAKRDTTRGAVTRKTRGPGNRRGAQWACDPQAKILGSLHKIAAAPSDSPLWVMLSLKVGQVLALVDTGAKFSCVQSDVIEYLYLANKLCKFCSCSVSCTLTDWTHCKVTNAVRLHLKLLKFMWDHEFKVLDAGPFPVILGLDFFTWTQMVIDVSSKRFSF